MPCIWPYGFRIISTFLFQFYTAKFNANFKTTYVENSIKGLKKKKKPKTFK